MKRFKYNILSALLLLIISGNSFGQELHQHTTDCSPFPWSLRIFLSPLITNLTSNQFMSEEKTGYGYNFGGDLVYTFYKKNRLSFNASLGLGVTNYNSSRQGNYVNQLWTSEFEQTLSAQQRFYLTETLNGINENQQMTFLDIPFKLGVDYAFSSRWAGYATVGIAYGVNLNATYNSTATLTRTGFYPDYNALIFDVDVPGSPYYYPTNKAVSGSGNINAQNNLSLEGTLGAKYKISPIVSLFLGGKIMNGLQSVKTSPATTIFATSATTLNSLASRSDNVETRAYGLELGLQINLGNCAQAAKSVALSGNVTDAATSQPLASTLVLKSNRKTIQSVQTDKNGKYKTKIPPGYVYSAEVSSPGYVTDIQSIDVSNNPTATKKDFALKPTPKTISLSGKVFDSKTSLPLQATLLTNSTGKTAKTSSDGKFSIDLPKGKKSDVSASANGYVTQNKTFDVTENGKDMLNDFALVPVKQNVQFTGKVYDNKSNAPVRASITIKSNGHVVKTLEPDNNGAFDFNLPKGKVYDVEVSAKGYVPDLQTFDLTNNDADVQVNFPLSKIEMDLVFKFKNVNFHFDTADLTPEAKNILNMVSKTLSENPNLKLNISGHTDNFGTEEYNQDLSIRRANSVKNYLVEKGATASNLMTFGYGLTQPIATNNTIEGRAENRRVEFKVVGK